MRARNTCRILGLTPIVMLAVLVLLAARSWQPAAEAQTRGGVLRIGMTAADIPYTPGQPDQGGEGYRFIGYQMYDALMQLGSQPGRSATRASSGTGGVLGSQQGR